MPRPRKSLEQHVLEGTYREDRHGPLPDHLRRELGRSEQPEQLASRNVRRVEPNNNHTSVLVLNTASGCGISKPDDLEGDASVIWDWLIERLGGTVTERDEMRLADLARWWAELYRVRRELRNYLPGSIHYSRTMSALDTCEAYVDKGSQRFGLTPADRAKLRIDQGSVQAAKVPTRPKTSLDRSGPPGS